VARAKVSVSVDAGLLAAVDEFVAGRDGVDRSGVFDEALRLWHARRQDEAMATQFAEPDDVDPAEWRSWRAIRDEAARRALGRAGA
jgi:hypothetical protein